MLDITTLTMKERTELLWSILGNYVGPIEFPEPTNKDRRIGIMPMFTENPIPPGKFVPVSRYLNRAWKPYRIVVQEVPYTMDRYVVQPRKRWQKQKPPVRETTEHVAERRVWTLDAFFVGDRGCFESCGPVNGDSFAPDKNLECDWPVAHLGQQIAFHVMHNAPVAIPFRALILGMQVRREENCAPRFDGLGVVE